MKVLLVLRHAKASRSAPSGDDFDRRLELRGREEASAVGRLLRARGIAFDAIVASPAVRVVETVSAVIEAAGTAVEPAYDRRIYNAEPETLLEIIRDTDDSIQRMLLVGHNPGLQQLLLGLSDDDLTGLRATIAAGFPTAALAELHLAIEHWRDAGRGTGRVASLVRPDDLHFGLSGVN
jgi:phosphohistidine phosphatase